MTAPAIFEPNDARGWAERITTCWRQSVEAIIEAGRLLTDAKAALAHGEFQAMIDTDLPFNPSTARRLMAIANDARISKRSHVNVLPPHWGTLYELTKLDDETFEEKIADGTINPSMQRGDISTAVKQTKRTLREYLLGQKMLAAPVRKYGVIVEDFEWDHETWSEKGRDRAAENHYPVSKDAHTAEEIVERTKPRFECADENCVLFMWTTLQHLAIAVDVLRQRGFDYRSSYAWGKDKIGLGRWNREKHEILLIGVKGKIDCPAPGTQWDSLIIAPRGAHSEKPDIFLEMIEAYYPTLPKIELNARRRRPGWEAWGLEAPDDPQHGADTSVRDDRGVVPVVEAEGKGGTHLPLGHGLEVRSETRTEAETGNADDRADSRSTDAPVPASTLDDDIEIPRALRRVALTESERAIIASIDTTNLNVNERTLIAKLRTPGAPFTELDRDYLAKIAAKVEAAAA